MENEETLRAKTAALGLHYKQWKDSEKEKNKRKDEFFALAAEAITAEGVAERIVEIEAPDEETAIKRISQQNPRWLVEDIRPHEEQEGAWEAIITENPEYVSFAYDNPDDGMTYSKQISSGSDYLDEEWLGEDDPELYGQLFYSLPWGDIIMKPLTALTDEQLSKVQKYVYEGKPTIKLAAPKETKEKE